MRGKCFGFLILLLSVDVANSQQTIDICKLLKHAKQFNHKRVRVSGSVYADIHSTTLASPECPQMPLVMRYEESAPAGFAEGVEDKRMQLDSRQLSVTVSGRFTAKVCVDRGCFSRLDVTQAQKWEFLPPEK